MIRSTKQKFASLPALLDRLIPGSENVHSSPTVAYAALRRWPLAIAHQEFLGALNPYYKRVEQITSEKLHEATETQQLGSPAMQPGLAVAYQQQQPASYAFIAGRRSLRQSRR